jgi:ABC-type Fe3+-siderophore transport system permease subunit
MACRPTFLRRETAGVALSIFSTTLVQVPFLLQLVGTSEWQRLSVLSFGFGIVIASGLILLRRRRHLSPPQACLVGLDTACLANAVLCLAVYSGAAGNLRSKSGWLVSMVIVWPIVFELSWLSGGPSEQRIYGQTSKRPP